MRLLNEEFKYGFTDDQLVEIIHAVAGYGRNEINFEQFNRYLLRRVEKRKAF